MHNELSDFSSPQIHINTPMHKHIHIDKLTHRYTSTPTHKHTHTDKPTERQIGAGVGRVWISGSVLVALDQSSWVDGNGFGCLWISIGGGDWCLWVDWNDSLRVHLSLWVGACGRDDA